MENEKILTVNVDGIDVAIRSTQQLEENFKDIQELSQKMGFTKTNEELSKLTRSVEKLVDTMNDAAKKAADMDRGLGRAGKSAGRLTLRSFVADMKRAVDLNNSFGGGLIGGFVGGAIGSAIEQGLQKLWEWITAESEAEKQTRLLNEATISATESFADEIVTLDANTDILKDNTSTMEEKQNALDELQETYPGYFDNLNLEEEYLADLDIAYQNVINSINSKIQTQVYEELASQKLLEITKKQQESEKSANAIRENRNSLESFFIQKIATLGGLLPNLYDIAEQGQKTLNDEIKKGQEEYDNLIQKLAEFKAESDKIKKEEEDAKNKDAKDKKASADLEQKLRENAIKGVTNLDEAIQFLNNVTKNGNIEQIQQARNLVELYGQEAIQRIKAAKDIGEVSGKTEKELNDLTLLYSQTTSFILDNLRDVANQIPLFNRAGAELTGQALSDAQTFFNELVQSATQTGEGFGTIIRKLAEKDIIVYDKAITGIADNTGAYISTFNDFVTLIAEQSNEYITATNATKQYENELELLEKQQEKAGNTIVDVQSKVNAALLASDELAGERNRSINEQLEQIANKAPELVAKALEAAGEMSFKVIKENLIQQAKAAVDEVFAAQNEYVQKATADFNKYLGFTAVGRTADEEFVILNEARLRLNGEQLAKLQKIVDTANLKLTSANREYNKKLTNIDNEAWDIILKNQSENNKALIRQQKADLETLGLNFEDYYDKLYSLDKENSERKQKLNEQYNQEEINELNAHAQELISIKNAEIAKELEIEVEKAFDLFKQEGISSEQRLVIVQEYENKRREIIQKGQADIDKITKDYSDLFFKTTETATNLSKEQIMSIFNESVSTLNNLYSAAVDYQTAIAQEAINNLQNIIANIEQQIADSQSKINELENDLEGKRSGRREAVLRGIEEEKQREQALIERKLALGRQLEVEERKQANRRKMFAISQALINGALAITNVWANNTMGYPLALAFNIPMTAAIGLTTGLQVATISRQQFAEGGFTESDPNWMRDDTGYRVAGVVHENEWVAPEWMVKHPQYSNVINDLENKRVNGFAQGGYTTITNSYATNYNSLTNDTDILSAFTSMQENMIELANRPIYVTATEVSNVNNNVAKKVKSVTIGG